jgi:hypothetical protein
VSEVNDDLAKRVEKITRVVETVNPDLHQYNLWQVDDLLGRLDYDDLTAAELDTIATALTAAYKRKHLPPLGFLDTRSRVQHMLQHMAYEELSHAELVSVALALAEAYGRKLRFVSPAARVIAQWPHRGSGLTG